MKIIMKNSFWIHALGIWLLGSLSAGCEENLAPYDTDTCWLRFDLDAPSDTLRSRSFVYAGSDAETDTVWINLKTIGKVRGYDRPVKLQQVQVRDSCAVAGKHFVAFDDPDMASLYAIPAGRTKAALPVVLKRDASLRTARVLLEIVIAGNEYFVPGFVEPERVQIWITDQVARPDLWNGTMNEKIGTWDPVLHQFLIDATGENWDNDYLRTLGFVEPTYEEWFGTVYEYDTDNEVYESVYMDYLASVLRQALAEENAARAGRGEEPLKRSDGEWLKIGK